MKLSKLKELISNYDNNKGFFRKNFGDPEQVRLLKDFVRKKQAGLTMGEDPEISLEEVKEFARANGNALDLSTDYLESGRASAQIFKSLVIDETIGKTFREIKIDIPKITNAAKLPTIISPNNEHLNLINNLTDNLSSYPINLGKIYLNDKIFDELKFEEEIAARLEIRKNALLLAQAVRTNSGYFSRLPDDLNIAIASLYGHPLKSTTCTQYATKIYFSKQKNNSSSASSSTSSPSTNLNNSTSSSSSCSATEAIPSAHSSSLTATVASSGSAGFSSCSSAASSSSSFFTHSTSSSFSSRLLSSTTPPMASPVADTVQETPRLDTDLTDVNSNPSNYIEGGCRMQ